MNKRLPLKIKLSSQIDNLHRKKKKKCKISDKNQLSNRIQITHHLRSSRRIFMPKYYLTFNKSVEVFFLIVKANLFYHLANANVQKR